MKIIIWGYNKTTDEILYYLHQQNYLEDVMFIAGQTTCEAIDGIEIKGADLNECLDDADYVIMCEQLDSEYDNNKIIPAEALIENVCFSFEEYITLKERKISIVSSSNWGKIVYESLYLDANSPFVDVRIEPDDYLRLIRDFDFYIGRPLTRGQNNSPMTDTYGYLDGEIKIYFPAETDFEMALQKWNKGIERFNYKDYFIEMDNFQNEKQLDAFKEIPKREKIAFYQKEEKEGAFFMPEWSNQFIRKKYRWYDNYIIRTAYREYDGIKPYNIAEVLMGKV